jgi:DNA-binding NarL/FixJ family response regulator
MHLRTSRSRDPLDADGGFGLNGIDAIIAIRSEFSSARVVVLTTFQGDVQPLRAFNCRSAILLLL